MAIYKLTLLGMAMRFELSKTRFARPSSSLAAYSISMPGISYQFSYPFVGKWLCSIKFIFPFSRVSRQVLVADETPL